MILLAAVLVGQTSRKRSSPGLRSLLPVLLVGGVGLLAGHAWAGGTLQYDARGNIKGRTVDGRASTYNYDVLDRIKSETGKATQAFCYDANGNRTCDLQANYTVAANSNRLATRAGVAVTYDNAGNLLTDQAIVGGALVNRTFTYWLSDQIKTVSIGGVLKATYYYNANRQRTRKVFTSPPTNTPGTTLYRYDPNGHLLEEIAGSAFTGTLGTSIAAGTSLITYVWKDEVQHLQAAALGNLACTSLTTPPSTETPLQAARTVQMGTPHSGSWAVRVVASTAVGMASKTGAVAAVWSMLPKGASGQPTTRQDFFRISYAKVTPPL